MDGGTKSRGISVQFWTRQFYEEQAERRAAQDAATFVAVNQWLRDRNQPNRNGDVFPSEFQQAPVLGGEIRHENRDVRWTPRFSHDVDELRTANLNGDDVRQALTDNALRDMLAEIDAGTIRSIEAAQGSPLPPPAPASPRRTALVAMGGYELQSQFPEHLGSPQVGDVIYFGGTQMRIASIAPDGQTISMIPMPADVIRGMRTNMVMVDEVADLDPQFVMPSVRVHQEFSIVPQPANPGALQDAIAGGITRESLLDAMRLMPEVEGRRIENDRRAANETLFRFLADDRPRPPYRNRVTDRVGPPPAARVPHKTRWRMAMTRRAIMDVIAGPRGFMPPVDPRLATDAVNNFTRTLMREDGFIRRILPPTPVLAP